MRKLFIFAALFLMATNVGGSGTLEWKTIAPGLEITVFKASHPAPHGDSKITVLRIDPAAWDLQFAGTSGAKEEDHTAREWCASRKFTAAINAGMFRQEGGVHAGYVLSGDHVYSRKITSYQSLAAFDPRDAGHPRFHIFDLDKPAVDVPRIVKDYGSAVQNLRLIQSPGVNKWHQENKRASEAALGEDKAGHILFIFARSPFSMYEMNQELLAANIGLVAAQYLEGGRKPSSTCTQAPPNWKCSAAMKPLSRKLTRTTNPGQFQMCSRSGRNLLRKNNSVSAYFVLLGALGTISALRELALA